MKPGLQATHKDRVLKVKQTIFVSVNKYYRTKMMKTVVPASFIIILIFGFSVKVYPCTPPKTPGNTTNSARLTICEGLSTKLSAKGIGKLGWYSAPTGGIYLGSDTNYITPELSKTTTFYVQDSTCAASVTRTAITVIVKPHAIADFTVNDICAERDSANFINLSQNAQTYVWKFGDGENSTEKSPKHFYSTFLKGLEVPNITLVAVNSNGCSDSINKSIGLYANPKSDFTFTANKNEVTFKAGQVGNTIYKWVFGNIDSSLIPNPTYTFPKSGSYTVCLKVTNAGNCFSETCKEVLVTAGISKTIKPNGFKIYPSPNQGSFTFEKGETKEIVSIEILNQMGQIIHKAELKDYLNPLNLNLANGIYLIRAFNGEQTESKNSYKEIAPLLQGTLLFHSTQKIYISQIPL